MDLVSRSDALHARVRAFIEATCAEPAETSDIRTSQAGGPHGAPLASSREFGAGFDALAADISRFQIENVAPLTRLARARGLTPEHVHTAADIPAVPTDVFRFTRVAAHPPELDVAVFRTSGTTVGARGEHPLRTLATYDAAALAWGSRFLFEGRHDLTVISLTPPPEESTDSSLVHMISLFSKAQRGPVTWHLGGGALDPRTVATACEQARSEARPVLLFGTSFAFVYLLDAAARHDFRLPDGSRAMLTGGFKGRSREVPEAELRTAIAAAFTLPDPNVVGEYGMTELSSQLYEPTLVRPDARHGVYTSPPWVRVTAVDPDTLAPVPPGEIGIARIVDLANIDSAVAIQTADRVRITTGGIELLGRQPGAVPRGCSLTIEEALG